jgi:AcrR family transcriptional regulator
MRKRLNTEIETQIKNGDLVRMRHLQIATGATKLFIKKGYFKTTVREISKATGITIGNLYDYITKKEDVLYLVFDVFHSMWVKSLEEEAAFESDDPVGQLKISLRKMFELVESHRDMIRLMYTETKLLPKEFLAQILEKESGLVKYFERILGNGIEKGVFKIKDPFLMANIIVYLISIEPLRGWNLRKKYTVRQLNESVIEFILDKVL